MVAKGNRGRRLRGPFLLSALPGGLQPERGKRGGGVGGRRQTGACARFTAQTESGGGGGGGWGTARSRVLGGRGSRAEPNRCC